MSRFKRMKTTDVEPRQPKITSFFKSLRVNDQSKPATFSASLPGQVKLDSCKLIKDSQKANIEVSTKIKNVSRVDICDKTIAAICLDFSPLSHSASKNGNRCPEFKKIPETTFVVDAFHYGTIPGISCYFLSHFHSDHYQGLTSKFQLPLICNQVTANLVMMKLRVQGTFIHVLPMEKPCLINGIEVTLIDANHCPGSVMFLFRYKHGGTLLHTGDFRATPTMEQHPLLTSNKINIIFLDTTYCKPMYKFPDQQVVLEACVKLAIKHFAEDKKTLFVCGSYTIGKEKVFIEIAKALGLKVWANKDKMKVLNCLEDHFLSSILTTDESEAHIHVLPLGNVNFNFLHQHLLKFQHRFNRVIGLAPSGWQFKGKKSNTEFNFRKQDSVTIYGNFIVEYLILVL
ncbi:DNA cross-link repair 1A protein, variant 2 [Chamberlinius hualienensis]